MNKKTPLDRAMKDAENLIQSSSGDHQRACVKAMELERVASSFKAKDRWFLARMQVIRASQYAASIA
jgi:hypothetical protein